MIVKRVATSEFVATVKVLASEPDTVNKGYHDLQIEVMESFKGEALSSIKVSSMLHTSCAFLPSVGSEWLIFASMHNGFLSFGFCSGAVDLNPEKWIDIPGAFAGNRPSVKRKIEFLRFVKHNELILNEYSALGIGFDQKLKGYAGSAGEFSVYTFKVGKRSSIRKIKVVKKFTNPELARAVKKGLKTGFKGDPRLAIIPAGTVVVSTLFFYEGREKRNSSVGIYCR